MFEIATSGNTGHLQLLLSALSDTTQVTENQSCFITLQLRAATDK